MTQTLLYTNQSLQLGDNDKSQRWGGRHLSSRADYVERLQNDLTALGIYLDKIDGDFGDRTQEAVQYLQWNAGYLNQRLQKGRLLSVSPTLRTKINGIVDIPTANEIAIWKRNDFRATGDLVKLDVKNYPGLELSSLFAKFDLPSLSGEEFIVSRVVVPMIEHASNVASSLGLTIILNQTFRLQGTRVDGAVVPPAKKSLHLIGHAIDCNIVDGTNWNTSRTFALKQETPKARKFINAMKQLPLVRWGGDFQQPDTPHFDMVLNEPDIVYDCKCFFNQMSLKLRQSIRTGGLS